LAVPYGPSSGPRTCALLALCSGFP
jgi:hypothetical protein